MRKVIGSIVILIYVLVILWGIRDSDSFIIESCAWVSIGSFFAAIVVVLISSRLEKTEVATKIVFALMLTGVLCTLLTVFGFVGGGGASLHIPPLPR
jgi:hypothetical protein